MTTADTEPEYDHGDPDAAGPGPRRRRARLVWAACALLLVGLLGAGADRLAIHAARPGDASAEAGFARDMSHHHAQAVEMAMIAWQRGTNNEVQGFGYDIATTQQAQIGIMKRWLQEWNLLPTGQRPTMAWMPDGAAGLESDGRMPGMASDAELDRLRTAAGRDFDILFLQLMIRHHLGGIHMVDAVLAANPRAEVKTLATSMKDGQQYDISDMRNLLTRLGGKPL
jgi:uncharacterized protein (DUF305 family)